MKVYISDCVSVPLFSTDVQYRQEWTYHARCKNDRKHASSRTTMPKEEKRKKNEERRTKKEERGKRKEERGKRKEERTEQDRSVSVTLVLNIFEGSIRRNVLPPTSPCWNRRSCQN